MWPRSADDDWCGEWEAIAYSLDSDAHAVLNSLVCLCPTSEECVAALAVQEDVASATGREQSVEHARQHLCSLARMGLARFAPTRKGREAWQPTEEGRLLVSHRRVSP